MRWQGNPKQRWGVSCLLRLGMDGRGETVRRSIALQAGRVCGPTPLSNGRQGPNQGVDWEHQHGISIDTLDNGNCSEQKQRPAFVYRAGMKASYPGSARALYRL